MDWIKTIKTLLKVKDIYGKGAKVKKLHDYANKIKPGKLETKDLRFFSNSKLDKRIAELDAYETQLDKALAENVELPPSGAMSLFGKWHQASKKSGPQSPEARKAAAAYAKALDAYQKRLKDSLATLKAEQAKLPEKITFTATMQTYSRNVHALMVKVIKVPNPFVPGTAWQAEMLVLSQDVQRYSGLMGSVNARLKKLSTKNAEAIKNLEGLIKNNAEWIKAVQDKAFGNPDVLKKNEKATKPKK